MDLHQLQVRYDARADRLLWRMSTQDQRLVAVWLTRRMVKMLWTPFQHLLAQAGVQTVLPHAAPAQVMPEARAMLAAQAREQALQGADFSQPFNDQPGSTTAVLGDEPLLPSAVDLGPAPDGRGLRLCLREDQGRRVDMSLTADLAAALSRLIEQAVASAEWDLALAAPPAPASAPTSAGPTWLN